jgi:hypothetical protein
MVLSVAYLGSRLSTLTLQGPSARERVEDLFSIEIKVNVYVHSLVEVKIVLMTLFLIHMHECFFLS